MRSQLSNIIYFLVIWSIQLGIPGQLLAQENPKDIYFDGLLEEKVLFSGASYFMNPLTGLRDQLDRSSIGVGGSLLFLSSKRIPIYFGVEMAGSNYDREAGYYFLDVNGVPVGADVETRTNIFYGHFLTRYAPWVNFPIAPYAEMAFGVKNLYTKTILSNLDDGPGSADGRNIDKGDWAFSYGGSIGFNIYVLQYRGIGFKFDVRCTYLRGGRAAYYVRNPDIPFSVNEPLDVFEIQTSTTDLLIPMVGFQLTFGRQYFETVD